MIEQTAKLYATVLRQLLPTGGYQIAPKTYVAQDVYAHAMALAQADLDAKRLLKTLEGVPLELLDEYEAEFGLPLQCRTTDHSNIEERLAVLKFIRDTKNVLNKKYLQQLLAIFGVELVELVRFKPIQSTASCISPVNTEQLRYKVVCKLRQPIQADMNCIIRHYLPAYLRIDIVEY